MRTARVDVAHSVLPTSNSLFAFTVDAAVILLTQMKRPHRFNIEVVDAFAGTTSYSITHGIVRRTSMKYTALEKTLTLVEWQGFWRFCDYLDLWDWKSEYSPSEVDLIFRDGMTWNVDIAFDKSKYVRANGNNVYPSFANESVATVSMDRFGLLVDFVDSMLLATDDRIRTFYSNET